MFGVSIFQIFFIKLAERRQGKLPTAIQIQREALVQIKRTVIENNLNDLANPKTAEMLENLLEDIVDKDVIVLVE